MSPVLARVTPAMAIAMIEDARSKGYRHGVVGIHGQPDPADETDHVHDGQTIRVRVAESALAAREVLLDAPADGWVALITDRSEDDLGAGILARLVGARVRRPDPWEAVRARFGARGIETALAALPRGRDLATAVLGATPEGGWPYAPAGVLTRAHLLRAVAQAHLGLEPDTVDQLGVLRWAVRADSAARVGALRAAHGDVLTDETLRWVAELTGVAAPLVRRLLSGGEVSELVPVALVLDVLVASPPAEAATPLAQLGARLGHTDLAGAAARTLGAAATAALADELGGPGARDTDVRRALDRADQLLRAIGGLDLAARSTLLPAGRRAREARLAATMLAHAAAPTESHLAAVSSAWADLLDHRDLGPLRDGTVRHDDLSRLEAGVRLCRWLVTPATDPGQQADADLTRLAQAHLRQWSWADTAVNDAAPGVDDDHLGDALSAVIGASLARRVVEERAFAGTLAAVTGRDAGWPTASGPLETDPSIRYLEHLLPSVVLPLARQHRTLLVVLDGMSAAAANEIVGDVTLRPEWREAGRAGATHRDGALAVLPSLTTVSRCSLLSGRLVTGEQSAEQRGHEALLRASGLRGRLFHKREIETREHGSSLARVVGEAIDSDDDLVTCVLNTIDDALDRSDPTGTEWTADAVKYLAPLLSRARVTGRLVVLTADHGHVVERRVSQQRSHPDRKKTRWRPAGTSPQEGEVAVSGRRVLVDDATGDVAPHGTDRHGSAVLAVDESVRFGPLKAGYHGGASAAEVVVPVVLLVPDVTDVPAGHHLLPPQAPVWWYGEADETPVVAADPSAPAPVVVDRAGTLSEELPAPPAESAQVSLGRAVVRSAVFATQISLAGRTTLTIESVAAFVDRAAGVPGGRLASPLAAQALSIPESRLRGAVAQLAKLLNVEGYRVVHTDPATGAVELDVAALREQFEVTR